MIVQAPPVETQTRNIAPTFAGHSDPYAVTHAVINGREIPPRSNKNGLLNAPTHDYSGNRSPFGLVMQVPTQTTGYRMDLPTAGPWDYPGTMTVGLIDEFVKVHSAVRPVIPEREEEEASRSVNLRILADGGLEGMIRAHELHHAQDQQRAIDEIIGAWDIELQAVSVRANAVTGTGPLELMGEYERLMDGVAEAQQVADRFADRMEADGNAYHQTEGGRPPVVSNFNLNEDRYQVWLRLDQV
jgi:hypothetical protein